MQHYLKYSFTLALPIHIAHPFSSPLPGGSAFLLLVSHCILIKQTLSL